MHHAFQSVKLKRRPCIQLQGSVPRDPAKNHGGVCYLREIISGRERREGATAHTTHNNRPFRSAYVHARSLSRALVCWPCLCSLSAVVSGKAKADRQSLRFQLRVLVTSCPDCLTLSPYTRRIPGPRQRGRKDKARLCWH